MRKMLLLVTFTVALAGCGQIEPAVPDTSLPTVVTTAPPTTGASAVPTASPSAVPTSAPTTMPPTVAASQPDATQDAMVAVARARLAAYLSVAEDALNVQSAEAKEWPDGAIGCPQAGRMYPQIVTPGYLIVFNSNGTSYEVHTGREDVIILCENKQPTPLNSAAQAQPAAPTGDTSNRPQTPLPTELPSAGNPSALGPNASTMVTMARNALANAIGVAASNITVVSAEEVEWRDGSLGCPQPGMMYPQVITPGYRITLEANGQSYTYHTDTRQRAIRCDNPSPRGQVTK